MADLTKKMLPENSTTKILTSHDLSNLRTVVSTSAAATTTPTTFGSSNYQHTRSLHGGSNLVLSTIPLDGHALFIQQGPLVTTAAPTIASNTQQQQHRLQQHRSTVLAPATSTTTTANGLRSTHANSINNLLAAAANPKATYISNVSVSGSGSSNGSNMPTTSKYVFLQQNGNIQYTTFEGGTGSSSSSHSNNSNNNPSSNNIGNIVLLATEPLDINGNGSGNIEQQNVIATGGTAVGDNDEELRSLTWLTKTNLINDIVTTAATAGGSSRSAKRNNICIINASNAHELIEELPPQHVASEEHVATSSNCNFAGDFADTKITTLSASDFQQQFVSSSKRFSGATTTTTTAAAATPIANNHHSKLKSLTNFALSQQEAGREPLQQASSQHVYSNIAALGGATTTVHVGPSGTTTVVEYKTTNGGFISTTPRQLLSSNVATSAAPTAGAVNSASTTITATNLSNNNNYVPSTSNSATPASNVNVVAAGSNMPKQLTTLTNTVVSSAAASGGGYNSAVAVATGNGTTNTLYQGQPNKAETTGNNSNNPNGSAGGGGGSSTTHHPHKKYLREKMHVSMKVPMHVAAAPLEQQDASVNNGSGSAASNITIVSSPASSNNSLSSGSSTGAVNGGSSPVSKSCFYPLGGGNTAVAINYSNNSCSSSSGFVAASGSSLASSITSPLATAAGMPTGYTIVAQCPQQLQPQQQQQQQHVVSSSPAMSSPEPSVKEYYTLTSSSSTPQHLQQQQQLIAMRSPTSYSSYDNDSLKDFEISTQHSSASGATRLTTSTPQSMHHHNSQQQQPKSSLHNNATTPQKQKHPNNVPYDPLVHTLNKPPYSFSSLIFMAIEGSNEKALPVKEIYAWIVQHFPYFKSAPTGWKNSVRHNLSLNKSFVKVEKAPNMGKGSLWRVEQQQRQNLIQAIRRSPFFPNSAVDKIALKSPSGSNSDANSSAGYDTIDGSVSSPISKTVSGAGMTAHLNSRFDPRQYPHLSKVFNELSEHNTLLDVAPDAAVDDEIPSDYSTSNHNSNNINNKYNYTPLIQNGGGTAVECGPAAGTYIMSAFSNFESMERLARDCGAESIDDVNAAAAMLALKHGPKVFAETFQNGAPVITSSPSEDHTYSAGGGSSTTGSGASTPLTNGHAAPPAQAIVFNGNGVGVVPMANGMPQNGCDNQSNCASSDAAYESSEENHNNITREELEDQQRHRDGVDALLSLSLSSVIDSSSSSSPIKRTSSTSVDEEQQMSAALEHNVGARIPKMTLLDNNTYSPPHHAQQQQQHSILDEGYNTQGYYGSANAASLHQQQLHQMVISPSPPKKSKLCRSLRTKIKRKTPWMR